MEIWSQAGIIGVNIQSAIDNGKNIHCHQACAYPILVHNTYMFKENHKHQHMHSQAQHCWSRPFDCMGSKIYSVVNVHKSIGDAVCKLLGTTSLIDAVTGRSRWI